MDVFPVCESPRTNILAFNFIISKGGMMNSAITQINYFYIFYYFSYSNLAKSNKKNNLKVIFAQNQ